MNLKEIVKEFNLKVVSASDNLDREVSGGYVSDLMSDVMANSKSGDIWVTLQIHQNIVAVASLKDIVGIIIIGGRKAEEETIKKAETENIPILETQLPAFEIVGKLYELGIGRADQDEK